MKNNQFVSEVKPLISRLKSTMENFSTLMSQHDRPIGAWNKKSIEIIEQLPLSRQEQILRSLERQLGYYYSAEKEQIYPYQELRVLWRILNKEGFRYCDDLFEHLKETDVIEIYLADFTQFFANSVFLTNCSYDLSDLFAYEWPQLFSRPQEYTLDVISGCQRALAMDFQNKRTENFNIPPHVGTEVFSQDRIQLEINMGVYSPLFNEHKEIAGFIATFQPRKIHN